MSLASRIASASSSNGTTATTGPKISSRHCGEPACRPAARTVGGNQKPGPSGQSPRKATGASSGT